MRKGVISKMHSYDLDNNREILVNFLISLRFEIVEAQSGAEAIALAQEHQPDLVLLDLVMPAVDGWLVTQHLRQNPQFADLPVIIVSASTLSTNESQAYEVGASSFIAKPLDFEQLLRIIEQHLNLQWITTNGDQRSLLSSQFLSAKNIAEQPLVIPHLEILTRLKEIILQGDIRGSISQS
jgi:two-component system, chemotaxis family, CheB/CheR fusion protein